MYILEKRAWIYNGDHMSPTPLREPKVHIELSEKGELKRMEAMDLPLSPRDMEQWPIGTSLNIPLNSVIKCSRLTVSCNFFVNECFSQLHFYGSW